MFRDELFQGRQLFPKRCFFDLTRSQCCCFYPGCLIIIARDSFRFHSLFDFFPRQDAGFCITSTCCFSAGLLQLGFGTGQFCCSLWPSAACQFSQCQLGLSDLGQQFIRIQYHQQITWFNLIAFLHQTLQNHTANFTTYLGT